MSVAPSSVLDLLLAELESRRAELEPVLVRSDGRALLLEVSVKAAVRHVGVHLYVHPDLVGTDAA